MKRMILVASFIGAFIPIDAAWVFADLFNALMSVPNFLALLVLSCRSDFEYT